MKHAYSLRTFSMFAVGAASTVAGCGSAPDWPAAGEQVGSARIAIVQAPADVQCVEITVVGSRTIDRTFDVTPGQSTVINMSGLPVGNDTFTGLAFATGCASVGMGSQPGWTSDPTTAAVTSSSPVTVTLAMKRNGQANVNVDFQDECGAAGVACDGMGTPCCSGLTCTSTPMGSFCQAPTCISSGPCDAMGTPCCAGLTCTSTPMGSFCQTPTCLPSGPCDAMGTPCCAGLTCTSTAMGSFCLTPTCISSGPCDAMGTPCCAPRTCTSTAMGSFCL